VANVQQGDHGTLFECVATNIHGMVYSRGTRLMHKCMYIYFFQYETSAAKQHLK